MPDRQAPFDRPICVNFGKNRRSLTCDDVEQVVHHRSQTPDRKDSDSLTKMKCRSYIVAAMAIRLASLALVLVLSASVFAGLQLHSNEHECGMTSMDGMDCCEKAAQPANASLDVSLARLCCALVCPQSGSSGSNRPRIPLPSANQPIAIHPSTTQPVIDLLPSSVISAWAHSPPPYSSPAYIRHLALLI
jgi:hypothetical protein